MTSGQQLRELRCRAGLTQAEVARRTGIVTTVLSAYERGRREPGADTFLRIAAAIGFEPTWTRRLDPAVQGRRLVEVLELAEALPFRPRPMPRPRLRASQAAERAGEMSTLVEKVLAVAQVLGDHDVPFAFGGALALAYATEEPRGTRDIDVNVFVAPDEVDAVFAALPPGVAHTDADRRAVVRDEQVRLFWDGTPVDLFFAADPMHHEAAARRRWVEFAGTHIPVLAPLDLAVFKALFDRAKDWVDIETMRDSGTLDTRAVAAAVEALLGDDPRVDRLRRM